MDQEAYLNYYDGAYNRGETIITPRDTTKSNMTKTSMHPP